MMGVGLILFWPALIGLAATKDRENDLAQLRGEYNAVDQAARRKNTCALAAPVVEDEKAEPPRRDAPVPGRQQRG